MEIDHARCLAVVITDFGTIQTEILHTEAKFSTFTLKRIESYFHWRLTGMAKPENITAEEEVVAQKFYNEIMVRYIVNYSHFNQEEIYRTGFSRVLHYPELREVNVLANSLGLFENTPAMHLLMKECQRANRMKYWIGNDLTTYGAGNAEIAVLATPYHINQKSVGAIGLLGPMRIPYRTCFAALHQVSTYISETLTKMLYKYKITFRQPNQLTHYIEDAEKKLLSKSNAILLEDKRN